MARQQVGLVILSPIARRECFSSFGIQFIFAYCICYSGGDGSLGLAEGEVLAISRVYSATVFFGEPLGVWRSGSYFW